MPNNIPPETDFNPEPEQARTNIANFLLEQAEQDTLSKMISDKSNNPFIYAAQNGRLNKYLDKIEDPNILKNVLQLKDSKNNNLLHLASKEKSKNGNAGIESIKQKAAKFDGLWEKMQLEENDDGYIPLYLAVGCLRSNKRTEVLLEGTDEQTQRKMLLYENPYNKSIPLGYARFVGNEEGVENVNITFLLEKAKKLGILNEMLKKTITDMIEDLPENDRLILKATLSDQNS